MMYKQTYGMGGDSIYNIIFTGLLVGRIGHLPEMWGKNDCMGQQKKLLRRLRLH